MTAKDVIARMARAKYVERIVSSQMHTPRLSPALLDLVQTVYEALLKTDRARIVKLWNTTDDRGQRQMDFYISAIIRKQTEGTGTCWRTLYQGYGRRALPIIDDTLGGVEA